MKRRRKLIGFNQHIMNGAFIRYIFKMSVYCAIAGMTRCNPPSVALTCHAAPGLARAQRAVCARAPLAAGAALAGARDAARECRHQLRWHRWNCSGLLGKGGEPHASAVMKRGYRETAFAHALASAGAARAVARACAAGALLECACGARPAARWKWGGCSHNLQYGVAFARRFLDAAERGGDLQSRINLHNNRAGRLALAAKMEVRCKCHGMSGSCQLKTCWRAAPSMRVIGTVLREKFRSAMIVDQAGLNRGNPALRGRRRGKRRGRTRRAPAPSLLYYETSPSFCERDMPSGIPGTSGRACRRNASAPGGCDALCCGRGHDLIRHRRTKNCKCKFEWCCTVSCETCIEDKWIAVCK